MNTALRWVLGGMLALPQAAVAGAPPLAGAPYPPSRVIEGIIWHWDTLHTAAEGSDLWPITWGADGNLYTAWGDGGGFGGTDHVGRVALGFARIEGGPEQFRAINVNGGVNPEHPASFPKAGKTGGIVAAGKTLYAWIKPQNGPSKDIAYGVHWSEDGGATWRKSSWVFPGGSGSFYPSTFIQYGLGYSGVPERLRGYFYFYGVRRGNSGVFYLGRGGTGRLRDRASYEYFAGLRNGRPVWSPDTARLKPVFVDPRGTNDLSTVVYDAPLHRYLLANYHSGPGQLGIFDGPEPWGPWTTVTYEEAWGGMGASGEGLTCSFPAKWMARDGRTLWCVFAVYGDGAKQGIRAHDRFNLVQATLRLRPPSRPRPETPAREGGLRQR